jgi:perosamine synthetase
VTEPIPMSSPDLTAAEVAAVGEVLSTRWLALGPRLEAFEEAFAAYVGAAHAVGVNSGTSGLHLCVIAAGVGDGRFDRLSAPDLVITTPFSFVASANCVLYERAIPVFVDVDPVTGNIDPALVAQAVHDLARGGARAERWLPPSLRNIAKHPRSARRGTRGEYSRGTQHVARRSGAETSRKAVSPARGRLKAILPVHAFGQPADMDPILDVARQHDLAVIEDACEAVGAEYKGRKAGALGDAAVFAFYPNKQMTTGEGGMIVTDDEGWADLFRSLRNQGRDVFDAWLHHTRLGYNYRLDEMSAALGLAQLRRIDELLARRERVAAWYDERLAHLELVERPHLAPTTSRTSWFVYVVRIRPPADRDEVLRRLAEMGVASRPYFAPIHLQPFYRETFGYRQGDFPITEQLGDTSLALPFSGVMTEGQVDRVCTALQRALQ